MYLCIHTINKKEAKSTTINSRRNKRTKTKTNKKGTNKQNNYNQIHFENLKFLKFLGISFKQATIEQCYTTNKSKNIFKCLAVPKPIFWYFFNHPLSKRSSNKLTVNCAGS